MTQAGGNPDEGSLEFHPIFSARAASDQTRKDPRVHLCGGSQILFEKRAVQRIARRSETFTGAVRSLVARRVQDQQYTCIYSCGVRLSVLLFVICRHLGLAALF